MTQNQINYALDERLSFIKIGEQERASLIEAKPVISEALDGALDAFYKQISAYPEPSSFFTNPDHMTRAKGAQKRHWENISDAKFDDKYVNAVTTIGKVHARIGLEPRWYIGGYALLVSDILKAVIHDDCKGFFNRKIATGLSDKTSAIVKAALLDMDFAIAVYLDQLAEEKRIVEEQQAAQNSKRDDALQIFSDALNQLAEGNLEIRLADALPEEFQQMGTAYDTAMERLSDTLSSVRQATESTRDNSTAISKGAAQLASRTEQQAASLEQSSAALHELTQSVASTAETAVNASKTVNEFMKEIGLAEGVMEEALTSMNGIETSSKQVASTVAIIDEIAFQTNLLALNAGVEAARAGEAGKGFAVVAQEVRELAQRCSKAAKEISGLINSSGAQIEQGVVHVTHTSTALSKFVTDVNNVNELIGQIESSASQQSTTLGEINSAIENLDQITQQNAGMVEETTAATTSLTEEVNELARAMLRIKTGDSSEAGPGRNYRDAA